MFLQSLHKFILNITYEHFVFFHKSLLQFLCWLWGNICKILTRILMSRLLWELHSFVATDVGLRAKSYKYSSVFVLFGFNCSDCSSALLVDDVLGAFLLYPHPKKPNKGSLIIRFPSGLVTHAVKNSKGKFHLEVRDHLQKGFFSKKLFRLQINVPFFPEMPGWVWKSCCFDHTLHGGWWWAWMSSELCSGKSLLWLGGHWKQRFTFTAKWQERSIKKPG